MQDRQTYIYVAKLLLARMRKKTTMSPSEMEKKKWKEDELNRERYLSFSSAALGVPRSLEHQDSLSQARYGKVGVENMSDEPVSANVPERSASPQPSRKVSRSRLPEDRSISVPTQPVPQVSV